MTSRLTDLVTVAVLAFVGVRLVTGLRHSLASEGRTIVRRVVAGIRWRHVWPVPFVLALVIAAASLLIQVPPLDWGWWSAFGGEGSPVFGSSESTAGTLWEWIVPLAFVALLVPALPLFAYAEERMFRRGAERWSGRRRLAKVLAFGLIHAVIGIPLGSAIALSIGGAYFMVVYLAAIRRGETADGATLESTRAHTMYNAVIVALVGIVLVLDAVS